MKILTASFPYCLSWIVGGGFGQLCLVPFGAHSLDLYIGLVVGATTQTIVFLLEIEKDHYYHPDNY